MAQKSAVYIPIISATTSRCKTNLSTMIYSGGRKGYSIWFASVEGVTIDGMHLHFSKNSFTFLVVS